MAHERAYVNATSSWFDGEVARLYERALRRVLRTATLILAGVLLWAAWGQAGAWQQTSATVLTSVTDTGHGSVAHITFPDPRTGRTVTPAVPVTVRGEHPPGTTVDVWVRHDGTVTGSPRTWPRAALLVALLGPFVTLLLVTALHLTAPAWHRRAERLAVRAFLSAAPPASGWDLPARAAAQPPP